MKELSVTVLLSVLVSASASGRSSFQAHHSIVKGPQQRTRRRQQQQRLQLQGPPAVAFVSQQLQVRGGDQVYDDYNDGRGYQDGGRGSQQAADPYSYDDDQDYNDDHDRYDDRGGNPSPGISVPNIIKTGNRKIGLSLLGIGGALTLMGISLFFNKALMRLGNLFFVAGVPMTLGPGRTAGYFLQPKKARATGCLGFGIFLVFVGRPVLGIILEIFGLLNLFGNMFPVAMAVLKTMPVIGPLLRGEGRSRNDNARNSRYDDRDPYYDDDRGYDGRDSYYDDDRGYDSGRRDQDDYYYQRYR